MNKHTSSNVKPALARGSARASIAAALTLLSCGGALAAAPHAGAGRSFWSIFYHAIRPGFGIGVGIVFGVALASIISGAVDAWNSRKG